jgi:5-(carboxyamino)imidazole ribonucleotide mutase
MITGQNFVFPADEENINERIAKNLSTYQKQTTTIFSELTPTKTIGKAILILGSNKDEEFASKIIAKLNELNIPLELHIASAHKEPLKVLEIIAKYKNEKTVYITIAGRSNALSGFVAANCDRPVIACPPFADKIDMMVNIQSTLQMPSNVPVMTVLDPENAALAASRIIIF